MKQNGAFGNSEVVHYGQSIGFEGEQWGIKKEKLKVQAMEELS